MSARVSAPRVWLVVAAVGVLVAGEVLAIVGTGLATNAVLWVAAFAAVVVAAIEPTAEDVRVLPWVAVSGAVAPFLAAAIEPRRILAVGVSGVAVWAAVELLAAARAEGRIAGPVPGEDLRGPLAAARGARLDDVSLVAAIAGPVALAVDLAALVDVGGGIVVAALGGCGVLAARAVLTRADRTGADDAPQAS